MIQKRHLVVLVKILLALAVVWGVQHTLVTGWHELQKHPLTIHYPWLVLASVLYALSMLPAATFWRSSMLAMHENPGRWATFRAYCVGHLGKYVPGKAMVIILRAGLLKSQGIQTAVAAVSVFFETLTMMAVGAALGAVAIVVWMPNQPLYLAVAVVFILGVTLPTLPPVLSQLIRWTAVGKRYPTTAAKITNVGYRTLAWGWLCMLGCWLLQGASFWAAVTAVHDSTSLSPTQLILYTGCVSLAVVAGFASFIPGGLGVRDLVLMALLAPQLGESGDAKAIAIAVLLRFVWLITEVVLAAVLYLVSGPKQQQVITTTLAESDAGPTSLS